MTFRGTVGAFTVSIVLLVPLGMWSFGFEPPWASPPTPPLLPPLAVIRGMSQLVTTDVHLSTTVEGGNDHWETRYLVHGECHLGIDLSQVTYTRIDPVQRRAVLRLPHPHLIMSKVDHDRSEELWMRSRVWFPTSEQLVRAEVWKAADHKIERLGQEQHYVAQTMKQAELVLLQLFQGLTWTIKFEWEEVKPGADDGLQPGDQPDGRLASGPETPAANAAVEMTGDGRGAAVSLSGK
jgi:hypothetical protein